MNNKSEKIPEEIVLNLCNEIRSKHKKSFWPFGIGKMQCWGCWRFGKKNENGETFYHNICALSDENNRGCWQINKIYDKRFIND